MAKLLSTVLCHNVLVQRSGQRICFQIDIPRDVERIVGIETGIRNRYCRPLMPWRRDYTGGLLTLQAMGATDICYTSHVKVEQNTPLPTDLSFKHFVAGFKYWDWLMTNAAMHTGHREPDTLDIAAPRMLLGTYTDHWGASIQRNVTYRLSVYLWVTVNDRYNEPIKQTEQTVTICTAQ